jgi:hypothetical protein
MFSSYLNLEVKVITDIIIDQATQEYQADEDCSEDCSNGKGLCCEHLADAAELCEECQAEASNHTSYHCDDPTFESFIHG